MSSGIPEGFEEHKESGITPKQVVIAILVLLALVFIIVNREQVETSFLFFEVRTPHWVGMVITLALGIAIGWFLHARRSRRVE